MGWRLPAFVLATGLCVAQAPSPEHAPLDLAALAEEIDPRELPDLVALVPSSVLADARARVQRLTAAEIAEVWAAESGPMLSSVYMETIGNPDATLAEPVRLLREVKACQFLAKRWIAGDSSSRVFGEGGSESWRRCGEAATQRARGLMARLLREFPDTSSATEVLQWVSATAADPARGARLGREYLRRLGTTATRRAWLIQAELCLRTIDLDGVAAALEQATTTSPADRLERRRLDAESMFTLRRRLAAARQAATEATAPGLPGQLANLRLLMQCGGRGVVAEAQRLVETGASHGLLGAILAAHALRKGGVDGDEWARLASAQPRGGIEAASVWLMRAVTQLRPPAGAEELDKASIAKLQAELAQQLGDDPSEGAAILRWMGEMMTAGPTATLRSFKMLHDLHQRFPDSLPIYRGLLASAMIGDDTGGAREGVLQAIPAALADLHDVASLRARVFLLGELRANRPTDSPEFDRVLADLVAVQGDSSEADYLRGVAAWWNATPEDRGGRRDSEALRWFQRARVGPSDAGWWRTQAAVFVTSAAVGRELDWADASRIVALCHAVDDPDPARVPLAAQALLVATQPARVTRWCDWARGVEHLASTAVLEAAATVAWWRCEDREAARAAAQRALEALEKVGPGPYLPSDRGVLARSFIHCNTTLSSGWDAFEVKIDVDLDFWIVPSVPGPAALRVRADDK